MGTGWGTGALQTLRGRVLERDPQQALVPLVRARDCTPSFVSEFISPPLAPANPPGMHVHTGWYSSPLATIVAIMRRGHVCGNRTL